jgi:hypothetical protein
MPQPIVWFVFHEGINGKSSSTYPCIETMIISTNFICSHCHLVNKRLLLIVTHTYVIGLASKGSAMALGA